jgi:hypothetical protein
VRSAIVFGVVGLAFLGLAVLVLRSSSPAAIPVAYGSLVLGIVSLGLGILKIIYRRARLASAGSSPDGIGYNGPDIGYCGGHGHGHGDGGGFSGDGGGHDGGGH